MPTQNPLQIRCFFRLLLEIMTIGTTAANKWLKKYDI